MDRETGRAGEAIVAFSGGPSAEMCRDWGPRRVENYLNELGKVYKGIRGSYSGKARFMDWPGDAWSKASYSFPAPGQVTSQGRRSTTASAISTSPASTRVTRSWDSWKGR